MAWGSTTNTGGKNDSAVTGAITLAAGAAVAIDDRIVCTLTTWLSGASAPTNTISDNLSTPTVYTLDQETTFSDSGGICKVSTWSGSATVAGTPTFTYNGGAGVSTHGFSFAVYTGLNNSPTLANHVDVKAITTGSTTGVSTVSSGASAATGAANEMVLGVYGDDGWGATVTAGTGFTLRSNSGVAANTETGDQEDKDSGASGGTQTATFSISATAAWAVGVIVFQLAGAVTSLPPGLGPGEHMQPAMTMPMGW